MMAAPYRVAFSSSDLDKRQEKILLSLYQQSREGFLTDIKIRTTDSVITAHRNILAGACTYFEQIFRTNSREVKKGVLNMEGSIQGKTLQYVVQYCYGRPLYVEYRDVEDLIKACSVLGLAALQADLLRYVQNALATDNCFHWYTVARTFGFEMLLRKARYIMSTQLRQFCQTYSFKEMSLTELLDVVSGDNAMSPRQDDLVLAVIRWLNYDAATREAQTPALLQHVNYARCSRKLLAELAELGQPQSSLRALIKPWIQNDLVPNIERATKTDHRNMLIVIGEEHKTRGPRLLKCWVARRGDEESGAGPGKQLQWVDRACTVKGSKHQLKHDATKRPSSQESNKSAESDDEMLVWDEETSTPLDESTTYHRPIVCFRNGFAVMNGGPTKKVPHFYNLDTRRWYDLPPCPETMLNTTVIYCNDSIYMLGDEYEGYLGTVRHLALATMTWARDPDMLVRQAWPLAAAVPGEGGGGGHIYVLTNEYCVREKPTTLQRFDLSNNQWSFRAPLPHNAPSTHNASMVCQQDSLYVVGGSYKICAQYVPSKDTWTLYKQTPALDHFGGVAVVKSGKIFLCGGGSKLEPNDEIEAFDDSACAWSVCSFRLPARLTFLSVAVMSAD